MALQTHMQYALFCSLRDVHCLHQLPCWHLWTSNNCYLHCNDNVQWSHSPGWSWREPRHGLNLSPTSTVSISKLSYQMMLPYASTPCGKQANSVLINNSSTFTCFSTLQQSMLNLTDYHKHYVWHLCPHLPYYFTTWETNSICSHDPFFTSLVYVEVVIN